MFRPIFFFFTKVGRFNKFANCPIKLCWAFFRNCRHAWINIWPHFTVFTQQEKCCVRSKSELMIKTSKSCDLNFANSGRDTEAKTSPRHLNFLKQLNKTTEMCYPYISGFKIHQGTQWVPRNTANTSHNNQIFFFKSTRGSWKKKIIWWILILIAMKLPFLPSARPVRKCRVGKQNFTQVLPWANYSAAFPRHLNSSRCPHCSEEPVTKIEKMAPA